MDWEDQPLFDVPEQEPKKKAKKPKITWTPLRHGRFLCEECVEMISTKQRNGVKPASFMRTEDEGTRVYCNEHAADQKMTDEKEGKWRVRK